MKSENVIEVVCKKTAHSIDKRTVIRRAGKILNFLKISGAEISVVLCADKMIRELNLNYRNIDKATDVLSFPMGDGLEEVEKKMLGDVIISLDTAFLQARNRGHSLRAEVTFLLIHGILHLLGYDHESDEQEKEMDFKTNELMKLFKE